MKENNIVKKAIEEHEMAVVACSFGRNSMVVLHAVIDECERQQKPYKIIWNDTHVEYPQQYKFNQEIIRKWNLEKHLIVAKSDTTFWSIKDKYGMSIAPRNSKNAVMRKATAYCCKYLKKNPTKRALEDFKSINYVYFTGLNAYESSNRYHSAQKYGEYFHSKTWAHAKCHPTLWWSDEQINNYIKANDIPLCEIYSYTGIEGYKVRNGCWSYPQGWHYGKGKWLKLYFPKLYEYLVTKTELGDYILKQKLGLMDGQIGFFSVEDIFESRPCFFEQFKWYQNCCKGRNFKMDKAIFDCLKMYDHQGAFENAINKDLKNPNDWMYMYSTKFRDYFKHYWTREYTSYFNLRNIFK